MGWWRASRVIIFLTTKRRFVMMTQRSAVSLILVFAVAVSFALLPFSAKGQTQKEPVVFGIIDPLSGPFKDVGTEGLWALEYAVDQINSKGGLLGHSVKLMKYDNQFRPDVAVRLARKAALEDGVKVLFQQSSSAVALALSKIAPELNLVHVILHAEADEITGSEFQPNTFRLGFSTYMHSAVLAQYFAQTQYKRFYLINMDYAFGHAVSDSFKKIFQRVKKPDQEIVGEDFHPMATKDFGPYVTKALAAKPDVVITGNFGPDITGLIKQGRELGLNAFIGTYYLDNPNWMNQIGEGCIGTMVGEMFLATVNTKANQDFIKSWQAWFKKAHPNEASIYQVPNTSWLPGNAALFVAEAIKKAGSADAGKLVKTMEGMSFESSTGKITMRACDHQIQADGWVAVAKKDHQFKNILKFPFLGEATRIPVDKISCPPAETGNQRCR
jgi:branched-chain amino acid transport system substrate-binding protein